MLEAVAGCPEDVVGIAGVAARIGGDEFALLLPGMSDRRAAALVDRARELVARDTPAIGAPVTISPGVCSTASAGDAEALRRLADGALYWAKAHGRDRCVRYDPRIAEELSAVERAARLERDQVRGHHERPDGRGYPEGLREGEISDGAAILGVADAFDAMTAARPYSEPLAHGEAIADCRRLAGRQFDPAVVAALEAVLA